MAWDNAYFADTVRAESYGRSRKAVVMHGTYQGRFVAITIRIPGSQWVCHPHPGGDEWGKPRWHGTKKVGRPPRWVRKDAKMALRRWLDGKR